MMTLTLLCIVVAATPARAPSTLVLARAPAAAPATPAPAPAAPAPPAGPAAGATAPAPLPSPDAGLPVLHLDDAVREALAAQPTLREARAQVLSSEALAAEARASLLPQVSANASYQRTTANYISRPGSIPSSFGGGAAGAGAQTSWNTYDYYSGGATLTQLVYDFGTWQRFRAASVGATAQGYAETATRETAVFTVRQAFFSAASAKALLRVADETLANQRKHLEQVQGYVEVGTRPEIDLAQARSNVASAEVQRINADNGYRTSKVQLANAMGREGPTDFEVADEQLLPVQGEGSTPRALLDLALGTRPEMAQLDEQVRSQELSVGAAKGAYLPALGVSTAATFGGTSRSTLGWNWNAQATLTWQLFQGGLTAAQVSGAEAQLAFTRAQRDALRQQIALEVEQARLAVTAGIAALDSSGKALENANVLLALAEARYQTGVGNIIELSDAQLAQANAAAQRVQAQYNLATARAQLVKALGRE